jgi:hypothetical protein
LKLWVGANKQQLAVPWAAAVECKADQGPTGNKEAKVFSLLNFLKNGLEAPVAANGVAVALVALDKLCQ